MTRWVVTCPKCGHRAPWVATGAPVTVRCVAPRITRQLRRQAEREGGSVAAFATPCGEEFVVNLPNEEAA